MNTYTRQVIERSVNMLAVASLTASHSKSEIRQLTRFTEFICELSEEESLTFRETLKQKVEASKEYYVKSRRIRRTPKKVSPDSLKMHKIQGNNI